jgi:cyanophycin synthetase
MMKISRLRALRGPNLWSRHTALEAAVQCDTTGNTAAAVRPLELRLRRLFPALGRLIGSRLSAAHLLEASALSLQTQAGCPVSFSRTVATAEAGLYQVVVQYSEEAVGQRAFALAEQLLAAAQADAAFDVAAAVAELRELDEDERLGPSTGCIVQAAAARGIPFQRLTSGSLVRLGWGVQQRKIWAAELDATSAVAESIAQDKHLTKRLLEAAGVPVPSGRPVVDLADGWALAQELGLPVVVKPLDGNQGKGVTVNIADEAHFTTAYRVAAEYGEVLVERYLPGDDFRLLVVGDKLVAGARRDPPSVTGDGVHSVRHLVDLVNADPRRGDGHATSLTKIRFDDIAIARLQLQGLTPESVPEKGRRVVLRVNANLSTGGTATDVTDEVHPELAARAVAAAQMVGLDICGVDLVCETVGRPLEDQRGGIVEVNAAPGLRMHLQPSYGKGRAVGEAIVDHLLGPRGHGRVPLVAVTGTNGKTTTVRLTAHLFAAAGLTVGMTNTDGVYVGGRQIDSGDCSGPRSARNVLSHPDVQAAVLETARGGMLREGLGFDQCLVGVVTNVGEGDHLGLNHVHTAEDVAALKQVVVQNVAPDGWAVLNAADPLVAKMAEACPGRVIYFAADGRLPLIAAQRTRGQRCVFVQGEAIVAIEGARRECLPLAGIPLTRGGRIGFQVQNAMAAIGAAWGAGLDFDTIRSGLASFVNDADNAPGRFNVMDFRGATVIADYGHNPDAMRALVAAVDGLRTPDRARRVVLISGAGDRRDEDLRAQTAILGDTFDDVVLYEDACQRGRADGEVVRLLREGLVGALRTRRVDEVRGELPAIDLALSRLQPGDVCLVLVDQVEEALAHLARRIAETPLTAVAEAAAVAA